MYPAKSACSAKSTCSAKYANVATGRRTPGVGGVGIEGVVDGLMVRVSAPSKLSPALLTDEWQAQIDQLESSGKTAVVVLEDEKFHRLAGAA